MKRLAALLLLLSIGVFSSCQCSDKPEVPPIGNAAAESADAGGDVFPS